MHAMNDQSQGSIRPNNYGLREFYFALLVSFQSAFVYITKKNKLFHFFHCIVRPDKNKTLSVITSRQHLFGFLRLTVVQK